MSKAGLEFHLVDVFARKAYGGNSLPVVIDRIGLTSQQMIEITREFRQFETVFIRPATYPEPWGMRIFDLREELPFAGHPVLGAAAVASRLLCNRQQIAFQLPQRLLQLEVGQQAEGAEDVVVWLDAGAAQRFPAQGLDKSALQMALSLATASLWGQWNPAVVSTGLRYLVAPVTTQELANARVSKPLDDILDACGAQFLVLVDPKEREMRHWTNDGALEDAATGSAAGAVAAWLVQQGEASQEDDILLRQGRHLSRDSELYVRVDSSGSVRLGGRVCPIGRGSLETLP